MIDFDITLKVGHERLQEVRMNGPNGGRGNERAEDGTEGEIQIEWSAWRMGKVRGIKRGRGRNNGKVG